MTLFLLCLGLLGCAASANGQDPPACEAAPGPAGSAASTCLGVGSPAPVAPHEDRRSVAGTPLAPCSTAPLTGWFRDGTCRTGPRDRGVHVVCAALTQEFLGYTQARGNDLSTPRPEVGFPGLKPGDQWCLCAARWEEARVAGVAPPVVLAATHHKALETTPQATLEKNALAP